MKSSILWLVAAFLALSTPAVAKETTNSRALEVTLLVFSGRPNPVFTITDPSEIKEILALAAALPRHSKQMSDDAVIPPRLGYQGIAVKNLSGESPDIAGFLVNRATVQLKRHASRAANSADGPAGASAASESRVDSKSALERRLVTLARQRGVIDDRVQQVIERGQ